MTTRMRSTSRSVSDIVRRYSVERGTLAERVGRRHRGVAALATQHRAPETGGIRCQEIVGERVDDEPAADLELALELPGSPSRVAGEQPDRFDLRVGVLGLAREVDGPDRAEQRLPRVAR